MIVDLVIIGGRLRLNRGGADVVPGVARLRVELRSRTEPRLAHHRATVESAARDLAAQIS